MMYMTSSTAEVMNGGLESVDTGERSERVMSEGGSSSWKAFSTERRMKNVVIAEKGARRRVSTLVRSAELRRTGGIVCGAVTSESGAGSGWEAY